ncbi:reverse transcriptase (RNA-dependent DNA polymerase) domain-containing protein [Hirsutella rhossiliensis]|uniref:Reverse transcriptase (RNA-dependent DNA polymerase) domain-containing protein n=1 Tax=Hirsutella rhossiliensis TaxID=111463 RepID=A0A9P8MKE5_9HYPO|nr:reverse transcriptase (RNA-dependent DNA polymerase) domain-containing protein [Hirsutella rhossiliensis]KAH0956972.1 reverse transcriptase (RNA-dependent DNA polymerase) domain-containing protein [Hirsutella rhossiliensis]
MQNHSFERLSSCFINQPDITFLKAYGCRAYPLTPQALQNRQKKDLKTDPHTEIGYLVGYDSTNIFRIWIPSTSEVRRVRDVTFNESIFYDGNDQPPEPIRRAWKYSFQPTSRTNQGDATTIVVQPEPSDHEDSDDQDEFHDIQHPYPTPDPASQAQCFSTNTKGQFHSSFFLGREEKLHRRHLPPEPTTYKELRTHRFGPQFREGAHAEWKALQQRGTFRAVPRDQVTGKLLPLTWVFKYKFDKHGFLTKFKARLCVRGDLQQLGDKDTYAATLAGRSFRILMAITAKFDLETRQLDAVNAFTNALLEDEEEVYKELTAAFRELGLTQCPDRTCIFQNDWLTVFFFVDDIVFLYRKENEDAADEMVAALKRKYAMTDQGNYNGSLVSESCVTDPTGSFGYAKTPTLKGWFNGQASPDQIQLYQSKVGSLNYAAAITRSDIAKPASKLAEFLNNPSEHHSKLADHLIEYLYATRYLAIQFQENPASTRIASDAAFADNKETRKSSQGSILTLFGGPIAWKAALRHVDIHTCWARQMIADGLTKALPGQKFATFVKQLGLVDISTLLGI